MPTIIDRTYAGTRRAFADVLRTVPGVIEAYPHEPDTTHAGAAWPVWVRTTYLTLGPGCLGETEWDLIVTLPTGAKGAAVAQGDVSIDAVATAIHLAGIGAVTAVEPQRLAPEMGGLPALAFRVTTTTNS